METWTRAAADATPDPQRALKNLAAFLEENPSQAEWLEAHARDIAVLFSTSQFLANYCISHPDILSEVVRQINVPSDRETLSASLLEKLGSPEGQDRQTSRPYTAEPAMKAVRQFRMREMLKIAFRDLLGKADLVETMHELSYLADVIIMQSLATVREALAGTYGRPETDTFSVIALGKLGGEELNFSSDVDLIFVYGTELGETSGVLTEQGILKNRISSHEYYCKVGEALNRFLSLNTEDGFAYRVDLRLRPEGQRGDIALALRGYEMYYESWGRAWERAMLLRARAVAGDISLGDDFLAMIRPFVYRKYLDFSSIDEIKGLKSRIDAKFKKGDIKRGFGGIREIEFFAQALQLIYAGREQLLRERSTLKVLHRLLQKGIIGHEDYGVLSDNYRFLRTLEHRLQQLNDIQTHTLPAAEQELQALAAKMGFSEKKIFMEDLEGRRAGVRTIYNSLFAEKREEAAVSSTLFSEELSDAEMKEYVAQAGFRDPGRAVRSIRAIQYSISNFQTLKGRKLLSEILPMFVDSALKTNAPDTALNHLQSFAQLLSSNESYLGVFVKNRELIGMLTYAFAESEYLSKMLIGKPSYLEMIGWEEGMRKTLRGLAGEIRAGITGGHSLQETVRILKKREEIRLGLFFLQHKMEVGDVIRGLSRTAEAILSACLAHFQDRPPDLAVIGFGKFGGRELSFSSDLDIIFICTGQVTQEHTKTAERLLRMLLSYTREGIAYHVDTRLRPDGSKGPLVSSLEGFKDYYCTGAAFWEFQALLKARPVGGDRSTGHRFQQLAREALISRATPILASDIGQMRERIVRELSKEAEGYDIKLGPGGIEEIEFLVQYLQLSSCSQHPRLLVQETLMAVRRLADASVMESGDAALLREAYVFYRTLESFLRLRGEQVLRRDADPLGSAAGFMGFQEVDRFLAEIEKRRVAVLGLRDKYASS